ncbi:hypothetical protein C8A01DRAFT_38285 [Parachaetomium inaequale]|uniref:Uncharacterized protein n=1 Tax=Parachaetomium inaequale TaxID=2588326 RepID=A0AAN6SPG6_9PEZI|nr:hypothetical protein C8A01DRAFT_38285 [Parachaetomium inaequale]
MEPGHAAHGAFFGGWSSYLRAFRHMACVVEQFVDEINGDMALDLAEPWGELELAEKIPTHGSHHCEKVTGTATDPNDIALVRAPTPIDHSAAQPKDIIPYCKEVGPSDRDSAIDISSPPSSWTTIRAQSQQTYEQIPYEEEDTWSDYESHAASRARCRARKTAAAQRNQETANPPSHQPTTATPTTREERQPKPRAQTPAEKEAAALERKKRVAACVQRSKSAIAALEQGRGGAWTADSFVDPSGRLGLAHEKHQELRRTYIAGQPAAFGLPKCTWRKSAVVLQAPRMDEEGKGVDGAAAALVAPTIRLTDSEGCEWSLRDSRSYEVAEGGEDDTILGWRPGYSRNREALWFSLLGIRELQLARAAAQGDGC